MRRLHTFPCSFQFCPSNFWICIASIGKPSLWPSSFTSIPGSRIATFSFMLRTASISDARVGVFIRLSASVIVSAAPQPYTWKGSFVSACGWYFLRPALYSFIAASLAHFGSSGSLK